MSIIWTNSTLSGLCDRLNDILILSTYAKIKNKILKFNYRTQPFENSIQENLRPLYRKEDYLLENLHKYIKFPENIIIYKENEIITLNKDEDEIFHNYLGGCYSPITFYNTFSSNLCCIEKFIETFYNQTKQVLFNINIDLLKYDNFVSVHLRRTDKVSNYTNRHHGIKIEELNELDNITYEIIEKFINKGYTNFYFCSDDKEILKNYINKYNSQINVINNDLSDYISFNTLEDQIKSVYTDLYIMSCSKYIILSQKHSSFSLFASLINKSTLIYIYDDIITNTEYNVLTHIFKYNNLIETNII